MCLVKVQVEAMNSEISSLKQKSIAIINSIDFHKEMISNCDKILSELNPEFADIQDRKYYIFPSFAAENSGWKKLVEMAKSITELMSMNKKLISQLNKE